MLKGSQRLEVVESNSLKGTVLLVTKGSKKRAMKLLDLEVDVIRAAKVYKGAKGVNGVHNAEEALLKAVAALQREEVKQHGKPS